jgi:hypothetical protein
MEALMDDRTKLDLFCIATFCVVDEVYQSSAILEPIRTRRNAHKGLSDVELITAVIVGEATGPHKGKALSRWVCCQFPGWFPQMPEWSRFLKRWKALSEVIDWIRVELQHRDGVVHDPHVIIDTMPIAVCTLGHAPRTKSFRGVADWGYCASKDEHDFGFQLHGLIALGGDMIDFELCAASVDELDGLEDLQEAYAHKVVLGDLGYLSRCRTEQIEADQQCQIWTPRRKNQKEQHDPSVHAFLCRVRRRIETVYSLLTETFSIAHVTARTIWGLAMRIKTKLLAYTVVKHLARQHGADYLDLSLEFNFN